jgi:hypothetical protein
MDNCEKMCFLFGLKIVQKRRIFIQLNISASYNLVRSTRSAFKIKKCQKVGYMVTV